jgi:hypothetical protein
MKKCLFIFIFLTGCTSLQDGASVRLLSESDSTDNCELLGVVTSNFFSATSPAHALNDVRNKAARLGGNAFQLILFSEIQIQATGNALLCP